MKTIGQRMREERERLQLSQEAFGKLGGVARVAQFNYERDERRPDAEYLSAVAAVGVDVLYVVTGERTPPRDGGVSLSHDEGELLAMYRACTPRDRALTRQVMRGYPAMSEDEQALARRVLAALVKEAPDAAAGAPAARSVATT